MPSKLRDESMPARTVSHNSVQLAIVVCAVASGFGIDWPPPRENPCLRSAADFCAFAELSTRDYPIPGFRRVVCVVNALRVIVRREEPGQYQRNRRSTTAQKLEKLSRGSASTRGLRFELSRKQFSGATASVLFHLLHENKIKF